MPTPLQYPLERSRAVQDKWLRLLDKGPQPPNPYHGDDDDDDEDEDAAEEEREPAVIREPGRDA